MVTVIPFDTTQSNPNVLSGYAQIDNGATATLAVPCGGRSVIRLGIPTAFTGTAITFTVQAFPPADPAARTASPVFRTLKDWNGSTVTKTVSANEIVEVPELSGAYAFTVVSNASEGGDRLIEVQCVGQHPSPSGGTKDTVDGTVTANQGTAGATPWPVVSEPISTSGAASSVYAPISSIVTAAFIKASPGNVFHYFATNANATVRWFQLHNKATIPVATDVPVLSVPIPAGTANNPGWTELSFNFADAFSTGIGFAISTTQATFTDAATAGEHVKIVEYL